VYRIDKICLDIGIKRDFIKIVLCQKEVGKLLNEEEKDLIIKFSPDIICLPELFYINSSIGNYEEAAGLFSDAKNYLKILSSEFNSILIGGTIVCKSIDGLRSRCYVYNKGIEEGFYDKRNLTENEKKAGFIPGDSYKLYEINGLRFTTLICNDIFSEEGFRWARQKKCELIFIPTGSPYKPGEKVVEKYKRDKDLYLTKARLSKALIIKICAVGCIFNNKLQGRSLVASEHKIEWRVNPKDELQEQFIFITLM
jgi:predicted amidohydrolase